MKQIKRDYILLKYAEGCYMGQEHHSIDSAIAHMEDLKKYPDYKDYKFKIVRIVETEEEIEHTEKH